MYNLKKAAWDIATGAIMSTLLITAATIRSNAQTFNPPSGFEQLYGNGPYDIQHTSAYNFDETFIATWDGPTWGGNVSIQKLNPSTFAVMGQITLVYPAGIRDLEAGMLHGNIGGSGAPFTIMIAYHELGVGHKVDFYDYDPGAFTVTYNSTQVLSGWVNYGRISIDCHIEYACAITWEEADIMVKVYHGGITVGPTYTMAGTSNGTVPDIAFTHDANLNVNVVYLNTSSMTLETEYYDFHLLLGGGGGSLLFNFWDSNPVTPTPINPVHPNIDGWDHGTENWAYSYTDNQADIKLRTKSGGIYATNVMNDGSIGNQSINTVFNSFPTPACSQSPGGGVMVVWYTEWTAANQTIVGVHVNDPGNAIVSTLDYYQVPSTPVASGYWLIPALNKMTEFNPAGNLYTVFPEDAFGNLDIKHRHHDWTNPTNYKHQPHQCEFARTEDEVDERTHFVTAYPNPFVDNLNLQIPSEYMDGQVIVKVTDLAGRVVGSFSANGTQVNDQLSSATSSLNAGIYQLSMEFEDTSADIITIQKVR